MGKELIKSESMLVTEIEKVQKRRIAAEESLTIPLSRSYNLNDVDLNIFSILCFFLCILKYRVLSTVFSFCFSF